VRHNLQAVLLAITLLAGCGYSVHSITFDEKAIFIKSVTNEIKIATEGNKYENRKTYPRLIENELTSALVAGFNTDGQLKVVNYETGALKLACVVKDYRKDTLRSTTTNDVIEQRIQLEVSMKLFDSNGKVIKDKEVVGETTYFLSGANQKTEVAAQGDLVDDTARRVTEAVVENW
jgi:outer membrane lipopolysaccharide assembly protein LptE/RlpB